MYVNKTHFLTRAELTYAEKKNNQEDKNWSREGKNLDKEMRKLNWKENLIKDAQFFNNSYFENISNFANFMIFSIKSLEISIYVILTVVVVINLDI